MATPTRPPSLVLPTTSYREYFARTETDIFCGCYSSFLAPYVIDLVAATVADVPAYVAQLIYLAA